jgi:hypothetical protein
LIPVAPHLVTKERFSHRDTETQRALRAGPSEQLRASVSLREIYFMRKSYCGTQNHRDGGCGIIAAPFSRREPARAQLDGQRGRKLGGHPFAHYQITLRLCGEPVLHARGFALVGQRRDEDRGVELLRQYRASSRIRRTN